MDKTYSPADIESRWYDAWEEKGYFAPDMDGDGEPFCIMLPPPNVTGSLHMGHAFQDTIMDILTRFARMQGRKTLWQPGTDHAGIATQMVVERQLAAEGQSRHDLGRQAFVDAVWDWKDSSGGTITRQMRRLGASVDWDNERFTMDESLSAAVAKVFVELHDEGLIYRGKRLVNWDPVLHTALSDLEVLSEERNGKIWRIRYPLVDGQGHVVVATTRPETLLGDTAVAVHPEDERNASLVGQQLRLPLTDRTITVIADDYVDPEFGTGCVKITPAHDFNDYEIGQRHNLEMINILNPDATLNDNAPEAYRGLDRFEARERIVADLEAAGLLDGVDKHSNKIPLGDRSGAVVEPYLTDQWYVKVESLAKPAIEAVEDGRIRFVPENWNKTYYNWMNDIQDWCISRQLWWGHRIPAWYDDEGGIYVGHDEADARQRAGLGDDVALRQDEDVLDTWFSSALWPFTTLGWPEKTDRLDTFYPTSVLVTGFDIIFFWVARMIMMGLRFMDDVPFREIYIHGLIRDGQGQKMSKSKGNVLDPIDLIDGIELDALVEKRTTGLMQPHMAPAIEKATRREFPDGIPAFGCDALRFTFANLATNGRDIRFDLGRIEGNRNFCNKLWNATRYVMMQVGEGTVQAPAEHSVIDRWILSRAGVMLQEVATQVENYRVDLASQALYEFTWNEYCDWYLELSKPALQNGSAAEQAATRHTLLAVLEMTLRALHPFTPFVTEEIWQRVREPLGIDGDSIMVQPWPQAPARDSEAEDHVDWMKGILGGIRKIRAELNLAPNRELRVELQQGSADDRERMAQFQPLVAALGRGEGFEWLPDDTDISTSAVALVGDLKVLIPLAGLVDPQAETDRINKQLAKEEAELQKARKKLSNPRFVDNAPKEVVTTERERLATHEARVDSLKAQLERLARL
ncbi:valine--tRNA ligase [Marinihelvus fidelis]|uniref:Valine--tRNA ligase n=1 Tax=Marinihelvus fidelis TaxID=2613842 RepID=A0A5N0T7N5_9GAMM|nr:valine--tRNA ligase [Marinihelvus fidelis]KAA9130791.1 valine--tRNA ligase [Marinihelvus fidelis]